MCIRDSANEGHQRRQQLQRAGDGKGAVEDHQRLVAQRLVCLLYTSDAADERSSVDLGGRRIIKKKKEHT